MLSLLLLLVATPAHAQDAGVIDGAFDSDAGEPEAPAHTLLKAEPFEELAPLQAPLTPPEPQAYETYFQVGTGLNLGLIDLVFSSGHFWVEASTVLGVPIASNQDPLFGAVLAGGYALDLGFNGSGHWYFEVFLEAVAGRFPHGNSGWLAGGGFGFGFRFNLANGWTLHFVMPCFGMAVEDYNPGFTFSTGEATLAFYAANAFGWSFFTVGRRF